MPITYTCGHPSRRKSFRYKGSVDQGVTLVFPSGNVLVSADFFASIRNEFVNQRVAGGFSMTDPPANGFGAWVRGNSAAFNTRALTPRHGSFIAAILPDAGWLTWELEGHTVYLNFGP